MRTLIIILLFILPIIQLNAQFTAIPDTAFEQRLINLGLDSSPIDGQVLTANIDTVTNLVLAPSYIIYDLTGIEDFIALTYLQCGSQYLSNLNFTQNTNLTWLECSYNVLTNLNITQNSALTYLRCESNPLGSLDITQNTSLVYLYCGGNQLTTLDVTQNTSLTYLDCQINQLSDLDVTQNINLTELDCKINQITAMDVTQNSLLVNLICRNNMISSLNVSQNLSLQVLACFNNQLSVLNLSQNSVLNNLSCNNNQLTCLNVKNGNNLNSTYFFATGNPNLTCIEVDDVAFSSSNSNWVKDAIASYSTNCGNPCSVGINELNFLEISIYPNPTDNLIHIDFDLSTNSVNAEFELLNITGKIILKKSLNQLSTQIDLSNYPKGMYFVKVESDKKAMIQKIVYQ